MAVHGLRRCGLPSCDKQELTVHEFKLCAACKEERYCCEEHGALHWKAHKPECRKKVAAKVAAAQD